MTMRTPIPHEFGGPLINNGDPPARVLLSFLIKKSSYLTSQAKVFHYEEMKYNGAGSDYLYVKEYN